MLVNARNMSDNKSMRDYSGLIIYILLEKSIAGKQIIFVWIIHYSFHSRTNNNRRESKLIKT